MNTLESNEAKSSTTKLWVENPMKPVFIMMMFVRAERESDWPLHLWTVTEMLPCFFAAGHQNYARCGDILEGFMKGEHVVRHKKGLWYGIWSDMYIESTLMRYKLVVTGQESSPTVGKAS